MNDPRIRENNGREFRADLFRCEILHAEIPYIPTGDLYDLREEMRMAAEWISARLMDIEGELSGRLATGDSGQAIVNQEKRGQGQFVNAETLPHECDADGIAALEAAGVQFGEMVDDLFVRVTLPDGWKKVPEDHSMWSRLEDDKGRKRASIFYKAAFYDRSAHMYVTRRFGCNVQPEGGYANWTMAATPDMRECVVRDLDEIVWKSAPRELPEDADWQIKDTIEKELRAEGLAWLEEHYPDWQNLAAYWD